MALQVFVAGKYYDKDDAKISVYDHGLLYGDGVFEGIRSYHGKVFRLKQHVQRLYDSAKAIHLTLPMTQQQMSDAVVETCRINILKGAYIRLVVPRGAGSLGLDIRRTS